MAGQIRLEQAMDLRVLIRVFDLAAAVLFTEVGRIVRPIPHAGPTDERQVAGRGRAGIEMPVVPAGGGDNERVALPVQLAELLVAGLPFQGETDAFQNQQQGSTAWITA